MNRLIDSKLVMNFSYLWLELCVDVVFTMNCLKSVLDSDRFICYCCYFSCFYCICRNVGAGGPR